MNSTPVSHCLCPSVRRPLTATTSAWPSLACPCPRCSFAPSPGLLLLWEQYPPPCCRALFPPSTHEPSFSPNDISYFLRPPSPSDLVFIFQIGRADTQLPWPGLWQAEAGGQELDPGLPHGWQGQLREPSPAASQGEQQQEQHTPDTVCTSAAACSVGLS